MKILIVDDNSELLKILKDNLEDLGVECHACECSLSALNLLDKDSNFDLVFSDIRLPGINGIELANTIGKMYKIPTVLTSGDFSYKDLKGSVHFVLKPYDFEEIYLMFENIIGKNKLNHTHSSVGPALN